MIPRPALLTAITIPTGGWTFKLYLSKTNPYDTAVTVTLAAGDYFLSGDNQADDLLYELQSKAQAGITALGSPFNDGYHGIYAFLANVSATTQRQVQIWFECGFAGHPQNHIKVAWTECTAGLYAALGFDGSADDTSPGTDAGTYFVADYAAPYSWYADEDSQLEDLPIYDKSTVSATQQRGPIDGRVKTCQLGEMFDGSLTLSWLSRSLMYSDGKDYGSTPPYPLVLNKGLECWWRQAMKGKQFRVYLHKQPIGFSPQEGLTPTLTTTTTVSDSGKSWAVNRWAGYILRAKLHTWRYNVAMAQEFYIASNTATKITVANTHPDGITLYSGSETFEIWEHTYKTYVLNVNQMKTFEPHPMSREIDYYGVTLPLFRYVAP